MKKRDNRYKGVSLIVLVVTIAIALIIMASIVGSYRGIDKKAKKAEFAKEIYTIQKQVDTYKLKNSKYPGNEEVEVTKGNDKKNEYQFYQEDDPKNFYAIKLEPSELLELDVEQLTRGFGKDNDTEDYYVISKETGIVYYLKGAKVDDKVYYALTDELQKIIGTKK